MGPWLDPCQWIQDKKIDLYSVQEKTLAELKVYEEEKHNWEVLHAMVAVKELLTPVRHALRPNVNISLRKMTFRLDV